jgi:hypothetical protein
MYGPENIRLDHEEVDREEVDREEVDREEVDREEVDHEEVHPLEVDREEAGLLSAGLLEAPELLLTYQNLEAALPILWGAQKIRIDSWVVDPWGQMACPAFETAQALATPMLSLEEDLLE